MNYSTVGVFLSVLWTKTCSVVTWGGWWGDGGGMVGGAVKLPESTHCVRLVTVGLAVLCQT